MADCIIPEGYKETSLGVIPKEWEVKRIKDIGTVVTGSTPSTSDMENYGNEYLFVSPVDLSGNKYIYNTEKKLSLKGYNLSRKIPTGAVLFTCIGSTIGKMGIAISPLACNQQINAIICNSNVNNEYLFYELSNRAKQIKLLAGEQAVPIVNKSDFENIRILLSPLSEQQKIAEILNVWDEAIEKQTRLIEKLELRKKGLMQQLLTGKKRLPGFSGGWKKAKLGDVTIFLSTNSFSREQLNSVKGNILNIHYGDVLVRYSSVLDVSKEDIPYINEQIEYSPKDYVNNGDVIMADTAEDAMVGRCCEVINIDNIKVVSGLHTILIHPIIKFAPKYLGYYLNSVRYHKQIISIMQGIKVYSITKDALKNTTIDIHDIEEQAAIANILSLCDHEVLLAKQKLSKFQWQKKGLMQVLLTGEKRIINNYGKY